MFVPAAKARKPLKQGTPHIRESPPSGNRSNWHSSPTPLQVLTCLSGLHHREECLPSPPSDRASFAIKL
eukprot:7332497-Pyramimonas_sp.AAC.1